MALQRVSCDPQTPAASLPVELMCHIFLECLPVATTLPSERDAPLLLLRVCRHWRRIALATPALWSSLAAFSSDLLFEPAACASSPSGTIDGHHAWLAAAAMIPLTLCLAVDCSSHIGTILHHHGARIGDLELRYEQAPALILAVLPNLGRLCVSGAPADTTQPITPLLAVPQLRQLELHGASPRLVICPFPHLLSFDATELCADDILLVMRAAPNLAQCRLGLQLWDGLSDGQRTRLAPHHLLRELSIADGGLDILAVLELPALRRLTLDIPADELLLSDETWFSQVLKWMAHLSIRLRPSAIATVETAAWLVNAERLSHLDLDNLGASFEAELLRLLDRRQHPTFLPSLTHLSLLRKRHVLHPLLSTILHTRSAPIATGLRPTSTQLAEVRLLWPAHCPISIPSEHASELRCLTGMRIFIGEDSPGAPNLLDSLTYPLSSTQSA